MERIINQVIFINHNETKLINVAAYARVSVDKETMHHSLMAQIDYYKHLIEDNPKWKLVDIYVDEGITGTTESRDSFQRMIDDAMSGNIDLIITKSITRFARNTVTLLETVRKFKENNIDVYFEEQNIHTISKDGELLLTILASYAQEESRSVSENMKWRVKKNFEEGLSWGTHLYGYKYENNQYEVIPEEAKVVKKIFDLYLEGNGVQAITKTLEDEGIKTRNNIFFSKSTIRGMLSNEYYTGDKILQKTYCKDFISKRTLINNGELTKYYVEDSHEGIISKEDFNKVQEMLKSKIESINWKVTKPQILPFSGMLECGCCGKHYSRKTTPYKHVWLCRTNNEKGIKACNSKQVPEEILFEVTNKILDTTSFDEKLFKKKIEKIIVKNDNFLTYVFNDGTLKDIKWENKSRSLSWTPEKKALARQKTLEQHKLRRANNGKGNSN